MAEIKSYHESFVDDDGKKWLKVAISFKAVRGMNKISLDDEPDPGSCAEEVINQVHEDCLELFKEFKE